MQNFLLILKENILKYVFLEYKFLLNIPRSMEINVSAGERFWGEELKWNTTFFRYVFLDKWSCVLVYFYQSWLKTAFLHFVPINCSHMLMFCFLCFFWRKYWSGLWKDLYIHRRILYDYCHWHTNILYAFNLTKSMSCCETIFPSSDALFTSPGDCFCGSRF